MFIKCARALQKMGCVNFNFFLKIDTCIYAYVVNEMENWICILMKSLFFLKYNLVLSLLNYVWMHLHNTYLTPKKYIWRTSHDIKHDIRARGNPNMNQDVKVTIDCPLDSLVNQTKAFSLTYMLYIIYNLLLVFLITFL